VMRRRCDGGGASALSGDGPGMIEDGRKRTSGVGPFTMGRATFYRARPGGEAAGEGLPWPTVSAP
jgi:hypothetical protein